ncbi:DUF2586 family protein [Bacteroides acidifaciens]|uniref:DUF2586 family protein n=1 Tax=Bacteroides acidifaciens TaxID=85831 RepID=A0A4S2B1V1_9BACE|nr:DUF2586 family protein [Bacteroides acidifaciens]TGY07472.1 DUF2586 family protein [Bacteroides acidifaciens]
MSTRLTINRTNGNVPKTLQGEDHITGFVAYLPDAETPASFKTDRVQPLSTIDAAEAAGITADATSWAVRVLHYHLSEIYRTNPAVSLYVGIFAKPTGASDAYSFAELKTVQNFAGGRIRQIGVWCGDRNMSADDIVTLQGIGDTLEDQAAELSILYAPKVANIKQITQDAAGIGKSRVSVVIGQAGSGTGATLYKDKGNAAKSSVSGLGTVLGLLSRAKVHQCIAWVRGFPTGINVPAFGDGTLYRDLDKALVEQLDKARYLFFVTQPGQTGSYMNDSHTMDEATSDYAAIESVRTMDKAVRGIRAKVVPDLAGNVYIDPETGKLKSYSVSYLESLANQALEEMERNGELSGYKVAIDPEQKVMSTGRIEFVIENVASPVVRHFNIKIGFSQTV